ncbi:MAG: ISAs1 family transposase, partial [Myxococcales bacterium]|nr:ISAs1 family transposase [Myxococcales bacterium]
AEDIAAFAKHNILWLRTFLTLKHGVPSHDTILNITALVDPIAVEETVRAWMAALCEPGALTTDGGHVAFDGQTLRGSANRRLRLSGVHMVSAFLTGEGVTLGSLRVDEKTNEITAIPDLIRSLNLRGATVTIDAMGCQPEIAKVIRAAEADYLLQVKENQELLLNNLKATAAEFARQALMLQLRELTHQATLAVRADPAIEVADADAFVTHLRRLRQQLARQRGPWAHWHTLLDSAVRTDASEFLDDPTFPDRRKVFLIQYLHYFNLVAGVYRALAKTLQPEVERLHQLLGRRVRILELACGSGQCTLRLGRLQVAHNWPIEVIGSDIVPTYVTQAQAAARAAGLPVQFEVVDALQLPPREPPWDILVCAGSLHHFSANQLAAIVQSAHRHGAQLVLGIDGRRSARMLAMLAVGGAVVLRPWVLHDAVTSARKFYSEAELEEIARFALPTAQVRAWPAAPCWSLWRVQLR